MNVRPLTLHAYVGLIALVGAALAAVVVGRSSSVPGLIGWPVVALGFAATELGVVHLRLGRNSFSFTLHEAVLVAAALLASPHDVVLGMVAGTATVMAAQRMDADKVVFNLGQYLLGAAVLVAVLQPHQAVVVDSPVGWVLAASAALLVGVSTMLLISVAIRISQGTAVRSTVLRSVRSSVVITGLSTALGLGVAAVARTGPVHLWLLAPSVVLVALGVRAHHRLQIHAAQLELVHDTVRSLAGIRDDHEALETLALRAVTAVNGEKAVIVLRPDDGPTRRLVAEDGAVRWEEIDADDAAELIATAMRGAGAARIPSDSNLLRSVFGGGVPAQALVTALAAGTRVHGALAVVQSNGAAAAGPRELDLLHSLALHAALALEANRLASANVVLRERSDADPLLGLLTLPALDDAIAATGGSQSLVYVSLSGIESVNDLYGFETGDRLLAAASGRLKNLVRPEDLVARLGGDEFGILIAGASDPFAIEAFGERVAQQLAIPFRLDGLDELVTISARVGVGFSEWGDCDAATLVRSAHEHLRRNRLRRHLGVDGF